MPDIDALKQALMEKANLTDEQATRAAQVALAFFSERVPQLGGMMEKAGGAEGLAGRIGGMFGRKD